jgi:CBS domain-containing protein
MKINYRGFVRERIQRNPVTISPDTDFFKARDLIREKGVRHLPVVDKNNRVVGILTDRDIREAAPSDATLLSVQELNYLLGKLKVSAFMTPKEKLITITPDTLIEEAVQLMHDNKIGCLPVLEGDKLYGVFTETGFEGLVITTSQGPVQKVSSSSELLSRDPSPSSHNRFLNPWRIPPDRSSFLSEFLLPWVGRSEREGCHPGP